MAEKWDLGQVKKSYEPIKEKYGLPSFEKLNADFHIEKIADNETDFVLREIRVCITEKFLNYLRFIESLINPSNTPMFVFAMIKSLEIKDKERLIDLYKKISKLEVELIELDLGYSEQKEAEAIKKYCEMWEEIKVKFSEVIEVIKTNWDNKVEYDKGNYLG